MELLYFTDKKEWDDFISRASVDDGAEFLQSYEWGELLKKEGKEIIRVGIKVGQEQAAAMLIKQPIGGAYFYWYAPRGPMGRAAAGRALIAEIKKINPRAVFLRMEPKEIEPREMVSPVSGDANLALNGGQKLMIKKTFSQQPEKTLILDLTLSESELLAAMRQKTRYNIHLAEKKGVEIKEGSAADFPEFWRLMNLTGERDKFRPHGAEHYQNLLSADKNFIKLFFARYRGRNIAAGLFCFWGGRVTYLHGASDDEFRNVMAPYLLQWSTIKAARAAHYKYYDFYGLDEKKWPGVTRFKLGFGGRVIEYPGTYDVIFRPVRYRLYDLIRIATRKLRKVL